jgi:hypothetical protein
MEMRPNSSEIILHLPQNYSPYTLKYFSSRTDFGVLTSRYQPCCLGVDMADSYFPCQLSPRHLVWST